MQTATNGGTMVDGDTYPICEVCEYVDWDRRTKDGDECPKCADREPQ